MWPILNYASRCWSFFSTMPTVEGCDNTWVDAFWVQNWNHICRLTHDSLFRFLLELNVLLYDVQQSSWLAFLKWAGRMNTVLRLLISGCFLTQYALIWRLHDQQLLWKNHDWNGSPSLRSGHHTCEIAKWWMVVILAKEEQWCHSEEYLLPLAPHQVTTYFDWEYRRQSHQVSYHIISPAAQGGADYYQQAVS
jgi:hypothetical protein